MINFLTEGGTFMWIILGASVFAGAIIVEKTIQLKSYKYKPTFFNDIINYVRQSDFSAAKLLCHGTSHPLAKVISIILKTENFEKVAVESEINKEIQKLIPRIQKHTTYLNMIGNVATLLGLIGTIQGLIASFSSLQGSSSASKAELLAAGISIAMNTTMFGLIVAIPCIVAYTIISNKESDIMQKYNETLTELFHIIEHEFVILPKK